MVLTIGHSTHSAGEFLRILEAHGVDLLADARTVPRSRHNPQFNRDQLAGFLAEAEIRYLWMRELGGLRHARPDSVNTGWRNARFRGYADYMQTPEFRRALDQLIVRRSRPLALPSLADRRRASCPRHSGRAYHGHRHFQAAFADSVRQGERHGNHVSGMMPGAPRSSC
jgi:hypothetical protein